MALPPPRARAADATTSTNPAAEPAKPRTTTRTTRTARPFAWRARVRLPRRARPYALVLLPAVLTLATGLWGLEREHSMWRDESTTYQVAHRDLGEIVRMLGTVDVVHGLYYLLMYAVFDCWDGGLWALRLPSVLAMAGAAAGVALIGRRLAGPRAGLAAGLVFALLPPVQRYAQEGRSYALVCACVVWGTYLLLRAVAGRTRRAWWGYAASMALACLLHEFAVLALLAHGLTLRCARVRGDAFWSWARAAASAAVPLAPLVVVSQQQAQQVAWISAPGVGQVATFLGLAFTAVALARVVRTAGERRGRIGLPALALPLFLVPTALLMAASALHPIYVDRYVLYGWLGFALLLGAALDRALRAARARGPATVGLLCGVVAALLVAQVPYALTLRTPDSRLDDTVAAARAVGELSEPGDGLLFLPFHRREPLMSAPDEFHGLRDLAQAQDAFSSGTLWGTELPPATIRARMLRAHRVTVITDPRPSARPSPQEAVERAVLRDHFTVCERRPVRGMRVVRYARPGTC
ncbi:glycosyltransferase family 39 protein [Streptomyces sp. 71268]|uniref:glycosyltransferase family 39 protein n=1 Tax=Streptomyces sp. 71268 TaxID=3002640 RepID=UPI0023F9FA04|nr:glycosyltransferase family 39 protein [Streptomyces sp. 71268]WEV28371.1 glycosyltransferase family 39 protein [Streptomyces sp. 71268]